MPVPNPDTPVEIGKPVQLVNVPELGVPRTGVVNVGLVNVLLVNVCVVSVPTKVVVASGNVMVLSAVGLTTVNVVSNSSAMEPSNTMLESDKYNPLTVGEDNVGLLENTNVVVPVSSVNAAAKLALDGVVKKVATLVPNPVTLDKGSPVQFVNKPELGVPSAGVTSVGLVANTNEPEPVSLVIAAAKLALEGVAKNVATPVPRPETPVEIGRPVQLVNVPELGVPRTGVVNVGLVNVLLVSVSLVARPTKVSVVVGRVNVPVFVMVEITGPVNVLFVRVCVPVNVTRVSVPEGTDSVLVPAVVMVNACALVMVMDDPLTPTLVILCALLSKPFFATKRFVVAMILYPLGELLYVNC
jgi:hypothetical protein